MEYLKNTTTIFFLLNAFGTLPLFLALTKNESIKGKISAAVIGNITALILLSAFIWLGDALMKFFGLSLSSFEIGGGIILFKIGLEMLNCTLSIDGYLKGADKIDKQGSCAIVPLGIPLLAGPGSIAIIMTMAITKSGGADELALNISLILAVFLSLIVWLVGGYIFHKYKGDAVRELLSKLGGLFLLILSVQMIINGVAKVLEK
jgi:multiple antibiotic resistance protein